MFNFYNIVKKNKEFKNPNYDLHGITLPFRMAVASGSGTGKTNSILNLITMMNGTFQKIILCVKSADEPLYQHLITTLKDSVEVYEDGEIAKIVDDGLSKLIIFDDLLYEKQEEIKKFYIYGRKKGYSSIYISQSFHGIPIDIRKNCQYFILGRSLLNKDLKIILTSFTSNLTNDEFVRLYREFTDKPLDVMLVDIENKNIRHNINQKVINL
jgi:hypothetical protein